MIKPTGKDGLTFRIYEKEVGMTGFSLGCNSNYLTPKQLKNMGFDRIETSLGRHLSYENMVKRNLKDIHEASTLDMGITVHLPIFLSEAWRETYDYYDGFYLDPDAEKRQLSFEVLEENLSQLKDFKGIDYFVIHFPGIYTMADDYEDFDGLLKTSLDRLQQLSQKYECKIALEYFPSNERFLSPLQWIEAIKPYDHLGILLDTGHLHFGCVLTNMSFDNVLETLAPHCLGFHIWNVWGEGAYGTSESYKIYHHIVPHIEQKKAEGWAFDTLPVMTRLRSFDKPIIIEASCKFKGEAYFIEALEILRNMTQC